MNAATIAIAMILDAALGEPGWLFSRVAHPTVVFGRAIGWLDSRLNGGESRKLRGILTIVILIAACLIVAQLIAALPGSKFFETLLAAMLLAQRSLVSHVAEVADTLRRSLAEGRAAVAHIVSRDTRALDETGVARAAIESAAENLSDGVVAPVFWLLIAGLPGLLIYKAINTADSMIGYENQRYAEFGWAAARLDDALNWVPARLTAGLIALAHLRFDIAGVVRRDAPLHRSPNAGWPETAMAVCLNVSLAGPRSYDGKIRDFPLVFAEGAPVLGATDIKRAVTALWKTWALTLVTVIILAVV